MIRGSRALLPALVVLAGSLTLADADAAVVNPLDARRVAPVGQQPVLRVASGSSHAASGEHSGPPVTAGQPAGHGRRAEREAKRAARKLQRRMRKQEQQQEMQAPQASFDPH